MKYYFFTFRSVTAAMHGNRSLERAGIPSLMARTPRELQQRGCGYSLRIKESLWKQAQQVLVADGNQFSRIYRKQGDGDWQEVVS